MDFIHSAVAVRAAQVIGGRYQFMPTQQIVLIRLADALAVGKQHAQAIRAKAIVEDTGKRNQARRRGGHAQLALLAVDQLTRYLACSET